MARDEYYDSAAQGRRPTSDFEWYAVDRTGRVALLTSAGFGAVPMLVFRDNGTYYLASHFFRSLPVRGGHVLLVAGKGDASGWQSAADRGLFGYDWDSPSGQYVAGHPYRLVTAPESPLTLADLPPAVRDWVTPIRFDVEFDRAVELVPESQFSELNL
jgi:hypothetical protein